MIMKKWALATTEQTKDKLIKAFVWHEFIDEYLFLSLQDTAQQPHQVPVLKFGNQYHLIFEFL